MREAFEKWATYNGYPVNTEGDGETHRDVRTHAAWCAWQAATAAAPQWKPIETAPKDGSEILLGDKYGSITVGYWRSKEGKLDSDLGFISWHTHWMPLPKLPKVTP